VQAALRPGFTMVLKEVSSGFPRFTSVVIDVVARVVAVVQIPAGGHTQNSHCAPLKYALKAIVPLTNTMIRSVLNMIRAFS